MVPSAGSRLAGEHEYAFKHALIRDVAYGTLPKSVRCRKHAEVGRFIEDRAGERGGRGRARRRPLRTRREPRRRGRARAEGARRDGGGASPPRRPGIAQRRCTRIRRRSATTRTCSSSWTPRPRGPGEDRREAGRCGAAARPGRLGGRAVGAMSRVPPRRGGLARVGDLHRKIGAGLWHRASARRRSTTTSAGSTCSRTVPHASSSCACTRGGVFVHAHGGQHARDLRASEKALRLAERLDEAAAASRAHGIFGRVFGRIGDTAKARENLERSVELARDSDPGEAVRACSRSAITPRHRRRIRGRGVVVHRGLQLAEQDLPSQVELHAALAQLAVYRADWPEVERATDASAALAEREGLLGKLCFPYVMRGVLGWRDGRWDDAAETAAGPTSSPSRWDDPRSRSPRYWLPPRFATAATSRAPRPLFASAGRLRASRPDRSVDRVDRVPRGHPGARRPPATRHTRPRSKPSASPSGSTIRSVGPSLPRRAERPILIRNREPRRSPRRDAWSELGRPIDAARCELLRATACSSPTRPRRPSHSRRVVVRRAGRPTSPSARTRSSAVATLGSARQDVGPDGDRRKRQREDRGERDQRHAPLRAREQAADTGCYRRERAGAPREGVWKRVVRRLGRRGRRRGQRGPGEPDHERDRREPRDRHREGDRARRQGPPGARERAGQYLGTAGSAWTRWRAI